MASHARRAVREREAVAALNGRRLLDGQDMQRLKERIDAEREAGDLLARHAVLSGPLRAVSGLAAVDGLTTKEAAKVLGISPATARVRAVPGPCRNACVRAAPSRLPDSAPRSRRSPGEHPGRIRGTGSAAS